MNCPYCGSDSQVADSRAAAEGIRRRRVCGDCKRRFTTYERLAPPSIRVNKRDGRTEPFDSAKVTRVLERVFRNRPTEEGALERMARALEAQLIDERVKSISSSELIRRLLVSLAAVDRVAHDRLAADYLDESGQLRIDPRPRDGATLPQLELFDEDGD